MASPRQVWLLPVLLVTVIATAVGALVARSVYAEQAAPPPPSVEPSASSVPPSQQPGPSDVKGTSDATTHPLYTSLQPVLQAYFNAINARDYRSWTGTVTAKRRNDQPEAKWRKDYRSTHDGSIVVYRIESDGGGSARVLMRFTSTQAVEDAPAELPVHCIHWNVVWGFAKEGDQWFLGAGTTALSPQHAEC